MARSRGNSQGKNHRPWEGDFTRFLGRLTKPQGGFTLKQWLKTGKGQASAQAKIDRHLARMKKEAS